MIWKPPVPWHSNGFLSEQIKKRADASHPIKLFQYDTYSTVMSSSFLNAANRRQLLTDSASQETYLNPTPLVLPAPYIDPAPIVLPSDVIDNAGYVETVGVIQPAPQIQPAPVILPSNAIKEKDRAYPMDKRNGMYHTLNYFTIQAILKCQQRSPGRTSPM